MRFYLSKLVACFIQISVSFSRQVSSRKIGIQKYCLVRKLAWILARPPFRIFMRSSCTVVQNMETFLSKYSSQSGVDRISGLFWYPVSSGGSNLPDQIYVIRPAEYPYTDWKCYGYPARYWIQYLVFGLGIRIRFFSVSYWLKKCGSGPTTLLCWG